MKVLIINHNGGSIYHGPNLRTYYAAKEMCKHGHKVTLVSSSFSHKYSVLPEITGDVTTEVIDGICFKWIKCIHYKNIIQRIFSHFQFGVKLIRFLGVVCKDADVVIFSGPPPEIFIFSLMVSKKLKAPVLSDVRDLWPLTQIEMSKINYLNPFTYFLYFCQFLMVKKSKCLITPLPGAGDYFSRIDHYKKTVVIENGFDLSRKDEPSPLLLKVVGGGRSIGKVNGDYISTDFLSLDRRFIVGYSGSFDRDNDIDSFIMAAKELQKRKDILFLMVGGGIRNVEIFNSVDGLNNVLVCDRVASSNVPNVLSLMDACFCALKPKSIYKYGVSLAKIYEYMAAKKPIIWMVSAFNNPVKDSGGGICVEPGNVPDLVDAIVFLADSESTYLSHLGSNAYHYLREHHSYEVLGKKWVDLVISQGEKDEF